MTCLFLFETVFSIPGSLQTPCVADDEHELLILLLSGLYCCEYRCMTGCMSMCPGQLYIEYPQLMKCDL